MQLHSIFIEIEISPRKYSGVCIKGKEVFVFLIAIGTVIYFTEETCIEHMCHITIYLDT